MINQINQLGNFIIPRKDPNLILHFDDLLLRLENDCSIKRGKINMVI